MKRVSVLFAFALAGCSAGPAPYSNTVNPAAVYCTESGGRFLLRETVEGVVGICALPDGSEIDSWEHFRAQSPEAAAAAEADKKTGV